MPKNTIRIYNLTLLCWLSIPVSILLIAWGTVLGAILSFFGVSAEAKVYSLFLSTLGLVTLGLLLGYFLENRRKKEKSGKRSGIPSGNNRISEFGEMDYREKIGTWERKQSVRTEIKIVVYKESPPK